MLDCVARKAPVNYYVIKETLKGKGYGAGTMQRDLQLLTKLGFLGTKTPRTKKKNRKVDYDLTVDGMVLFLSIASFIGSFQSRNNIKHLLHKYADLLPRISGIYGDIERLHFDDLAEVLLLTVASQFYDKSTISSFHDIHPLEAKKEFDTRLAEKRYNSKPFEHLFFMGMAPPSAYLRHQRVRLENALQSAEGTALRKQVIAELDQERQYHSAMVEVIDEKVKFLNLKR